MPVAELVGYFAMLAFVIAFVLVTMLAAGFVITRLQVWFAEAAFVRSQADCPSHQESSRDA